MTILDEVYERLRHTGPERDGWLSNHAPMAAEALIRHGRAHVVHRWLDSYADRLEGRPRGMSPFRRTSGVIRSATRCVRATGSTTSTVNSPTTLAGGARPLVAAAAAGHRRRRHARGDPRRPRRTRPARGRDRAARHRTRPGAGVLGGPVATARGARCRPLPGDRRRSALDAVSRVPDQRYGIRFRLAQLADLPDWPATAAAVPGGQDDVAARLADIVEAAVARHGTHGYASPVMTRARCHCAERVLQTLPALPSALWKPSLAAAWAATAAVTLLTPPPRPSPPAAVLDS